MCNLVFKIVIITIAVFGKEVEESRTTRTVLEVDYSELVGEAEMHKHNILKFLNETRVQVKYKTLFKNLLHKLLGKLLHE